MISSLKRSPGVSVKDAAITINYDKVSDNYDYSRRAGINDSNLLLELLDPMSDACVLDVGCGTGNYLERLKNKIYKTISYFL